MMETRQLYGNDRWILIFVCDVIVFSNNSDFSTWLFSVAEGLKFSPVPCLVHQQLLDCTCTKAAFKT